MFLFRLCSRQYASGLNCRHECKVHVRAETCEEGAPLVTPISLGPLQINRTNRDGGAGVPPPQFFQKKNNKDLIKEESLPLQLGKMFLHPWPTYLSTCYTALRETF